MAINLAVLVNQHARKNKRKHHAAATIEKEKLERVLNGSNARVDITIKPELVRGICQEYIRDRIETVVVSGGDGTVQNFQTHQFLELYREFGKGQTPIEFAKTMNARAIDPSSELILPAVYHRKRGTVNVYADTIGMKGKLSVVAEHLEDAAKKFPTFGTNVFRRVYVPMILLYSKENPNDLDSIQVMSMYADGFVYNFFEKYYAPKDRGGESTMATAFALIGRGVGSILGSGFLDALSYMITGADHASRHLYRSRFHEDLLKVTKNSLILDDCHLYETSIRNAAVLGTMGISLYGIKPFWRMPRGQEQFPVQLGSMGSESASYVNPTSQEFQIFCGNPSMASVVGAVPRLMFGKPPNIETIFDTTGRKFEISQNEPISYIADGTRHSAGNNVVMEIAYMQPFIMLDKPPSSDV